MTTIAIQPDRQGLSSGRFQSFSDRWFELAPELGVEALRVNAYAPDFFDQLNGCAAFLWWFGQPAYRRRPGQRIVAALTHARGLPAFPSWETCWHFEDKVAQSYLLQAAGVPTPRTWTFWHRQEAVSFLTNADYPLVFKLAAGITSANVMRVQNPAEARKWAARLFGSGLYSLAERAGVAARARAAARWLLRRPPGSRSVELQRGYLLVQEFLPDNAFDTRVTIIGDRAFAFRRYNRPGDFRASGSGRIDWDASMIAEDAVRLGFGAAQALRTQSLAVDVLRRGDEAVIAEISYYYEGWAVAACPGHWILRSHPYTGTLHWVEGPLRPEDAILHDLLARIGAPSGEAEDLLR